MSRKGDFGIPLNNTDCHDLRDGRSLVVADARQQRAVTAVERWFSPYVRPDPGRNAGGAPKQRNTNVENADLRAGRIAQDWQDKPTKLSHKDRHAHWTLRFIKAKRQDDGTIPSTDLAIPFFGYKSHISIDRKFRLIRKWKTTNAAVSDGARLREGLLDKTNMASAVWADTAYRSKANEDFMEKHGSVSKAHRKKPHLKPMPRHIQKSNAKKSVIQSRVEPVFADQKSQTGLFIRTVGITQATLKIGLASIVYNMRRFIFLERISATPQQLRGDKILTRIKMQSENQVHEPEINTLKI